ncbi:ferritin-like domain-containing protein [Patescibacteria group bacterium]|nr:ferritin-like domain-containing protein [Patescibacteria group bacterium]
MIEAVRLSHLITKFLQLETIAEALYLQHLHAVPSHLRPLFQEFAATETRHRLLFEELYREIHQKAAPRFRFSVWILCQWAEVLHLFGNTAVLRFECWIEAHAIRDYTRALEWIKEPEVRTTLTQILRDEKNHLGLEELLHLFREDEEAHITHMRRFL